MVSRDRLAPPVPSGKPDRALAQWMPFYGEDFMRSERVLCMEPEARYLYLCMLWRQWLEGSLPGDMETLCDIFRDIGVTEIVRSYCRDAQDHRGDDTGRWKNERATTQELLEQTLGCFQAGPDGRLRNARLEEIRAQQLKTVDAQRAKGVKGAEAKAAKKAAREAEKATKLLEQTSRSPQVNKIEMEIEREMDSASSVSTPQKEDTPQPPQGGGLIASAKKRRKPPEDFEAVLEREAYADLWSSLPLLSALERWRAYKRERGDGEIAGAAAAGLLNRALEWGAARMKLAVDHSTASGYDGLFEPPESRNGTAGVSAPTAKLAQRIAEFQALDAHGPLSLDQGERLALPQ